LDILIHFLLAALAILALHSNILLTANVAHKAFLARNFQSRLLRPITAHQELMFQTSLLPLQHRPLNHPSNNFQSETTIVFQSIAQPLLATHLNHHCRAPHLMANHMLIITAKLRLRP